MPTNRTIYTVGYTYRHYGDDTDVDYDVELDYVCSSRGSSAYRTSYGWVAPEPNEYDIIAVRGAEEQPVPKEILQAVLEAWADGGSQYQRMYDRIDNDYREATAVPHDHDHY